ncbi:putative FBD-associated F-box protein At3g50710 [Quercus suber]|uniref:putative FBD-associated F-box protein At3g50710 n=1 Tax=Quercus suber TaxID=58331 RepID=UPI000CE260DD|nr:putative FBD-associated F-box protein At3g50710 [Quercus suber]
MPLLLTLTLSALCRTLASPAYSPISQLENLSPRAFCRAGNFALNPPSDASFPSLRILHLALLNYANSESVSAILNACPVLRDLCLYVFLREDQGNFNIVIQSSSFKVHINSPALKYLIFKGHLIEDVVLENLSHLVALVLQVEIVNGVSIEDDERGCLQILCHAFGDNVPMFHNLFSLKFNGCLYFEWHAIRFLFGRAPKLQILAFESCPEHSYGQPTPDSSWEEPLDVPECLSSHLTTCNYKGFLGDKDEMQLVRQILKVARVLKTLKITVDGHLESEEKLCVRKAL